MPRWSSLRAAPFPLPGLTGKILNSYTLAAVQHHVFWVFLYLRQVQDTNEIIVDHDPLRPVLSPIKICETLNCDISDAIALVPDDGP